MTTPDPSSLCESLAEARSLMVTLELRIATLERSIDDLFELSVLTTSVRTIDELLSIAYSHEEVLVRQMRRTLKRIG
jgi:hypothetical protein